LVGSQRLLGDVIFLKDGTRIEGTVKHADDGWIVRANGKTSHFLPGDVESIELTPTTNPSPKAAQERLTSLRHSVEGLGDLNEIISRFQRLVDQNIDPLVTIDAKKDLAMWQDRAKQKMVKVGGDWVTPLQRDALVAQAGATAETARQLMKQGRAKEAEPLLTDVLNADPSNATALYLTALLRLQQNQIPPARQSFEATAAIIPNHPPTLNNLAIVLWRQHQYIQALQNFDGAMLASPVDKMILDNVAVALQTLPVDLQKSPVTQKVLGHFNEQDQKLAERMSHDGMHRFGSLWVSDHDLDQLKAQEKQIQDKLDALAGEFDRSRARMDQLSQNMADDQSEMARIEASSFAIDPTTGARVAVPLPNSYYDLQRDAQRAARERDAEGARLDTMKKQAQDLQATRPSLKNQGVMQPIGVEGTPIKISSPATQPTGKK
jgi:hypothetical protein